jgi:hypothetical protein
VTAVDTQTPTRHTLMTAGGTVVYLILAKVRVLRVPSVVVSGKRFLVDSCESHTPRQTDAFPRDLRQFDGKEHRFDDSHSEKLDIREAQTLMGNHGHFHDFSHDTVV